MSEVFTNNRIDRLHFSEFGNHTPIDILRDDLIHPILAGNKWRKLKYIVEDVLKHKKRHLLTFGGAYSNHLVATAFAGHYFGLETTGFVRGNEERPRNTHEQICLQYGMKLIHVSREAYRDKDQLVKTYFPDLNAIELIGEGGKHPLAGKGAAEILELLPGVYDYLILALGTGTTMEGLVEGLVNKQIPSKVIGISSLKGNSELNELMKKYPDRYWQIEHGYHRGKYAHQDPELLAFIKQFKSETGIGLEFVYTGKMMMAVCDLIKKQSIEPGKRVLCIHTGGINL